MTTIGAPEARPLRRDAVRNAEKISAVAMEVFAEKGLETTMADVANRAGVGVGTVYRRFGDKDGLIDALFVEKTDEVIEVAQRALATRDPADALLQFVIEGAESMAANKGLRQLILEGAHTPGEHGVHALERLNPLIAKMVGAAQDGGWLRTFVEPSDFPVLLIALGAVRDFGGAEHPDLWRRTLYLLINGMRSDSTVPTDISAPAAVDEREINDAAHRRLSSSGD
ncbi:TetR/AcrR family transcriptional regulator [Williamsia soli]|uniref:TetR/AcrR family transcriptional regulator n=1 Tax=Williamsia soli TaxID=364929 RepID=UPI001A9D16E3|nr:TetR/AcrR family transcriptional regulator [Williamsia soli]